jgi:hypothetical protein
VGESIYLAGASKIVAAFFSPAERGLPSGFFDSGSRAGLVRLAGLKVHKMIKFQAAINCTSM